MRESGDDDVYALTDNASLDPNKVVNIDLRPDSWNMQGPAAVSNGAVADSYQDFQLPAQVLSTANPQDPQDQQKAGSRRRRRRRRTKKARSSKRRRNKSRR